MGVCVCVHACVCAASLPFVSACYVYKTGTLPFLFIKCYGEPYSIATLGMTRSCRDTGNIYISDPMDTVSGVILDHQWFGPIKCHKNCLLLLGAERRRCCTQLLTEHRYHRSRQLFSILDTDHRVDQSSARGVGSWDLFGRCLACHEHDLQNYCYTDCVTRTCT